MDWFRHKNGMSTDAKLAFVASRVGQHKAFVFYLWSYLLERANACETRGKLSRFDREEAAFALDMDRETIDRIMVEFEARGLISDGGVTNWNRHQFQSDNSYDRVKRYREKQRNEDETLQPGTRNVSVTDRTEQNRTEQNISHERNGSPSKRVRSLDDLNLDDELREVAKAERRDPDRELDKFRTDCAAKGRAYKDYRAAFRNWLRSPYGREQEQQPGNVTGLKIKSGYGFGIV